MPLALGHFAVGLLTDSAVEKAKTTTRKKFLILFLLVNSPDIDILIGWLAAGNFYAFHRTFTHSILFAILMAAACSNLYKLFPSFPKLDYTWCYWMVISHLVADYLITPWEVSFLWPLPYLMPQSVNGILDHVPRYAAFEREAEVIIFCLCIYLLIKILGFAVNSAKRLRPA